MSNPVATTKDGEVTLEWATSAASVSLTRLTATGVILQVIPVPGTGSQKFKIGSEYGSAAVFRLSAERGGKKITQDVIVNITCPIVWFFRPEPEQCPNQPAQFAQMQFQVFERGYIIYVGSPNERVYVLEFTTVRAAAYPNSWATGAIFPTPNVPTPVSGITAVAQIGYIWATQPWLDGRPVFAAVGNPVSGVATYQGTFQQGLVASQFYVRGPDTTVYFLDLAGQTSWKPIGQVK